MSNSLTTLSWQVQEDNFDRITTNENGTRYYYKGDDLHRLDGPAVEWKDGSKAWFVNDKRHRLDGPAIERADGSAAWFQNDKRHRLDGPAIERADGSKEWYINGKEYTEEKFNEKVKELNKLSWQVQEDNFDRIYTDEEGNKRYFKGDKLHRLDGPAIEHANGSKSWWVDDRLHRLDGPAVMFYDGDKAWYQNGKLHRLDGPAIEYANRSKEYWIDGRSYTEVEFNEKVKELNKLSCQQLHNIKESSKNPNLGKCYQLSWQYITNNPSSTLVHGYITHRGSGNSIDHAWVEEDGEVYDPVLDWRIPKDAYYTLFNAEKIKEYSYDEAVEKGLETKVYGPWHTIDREVKTTPRSKRLSWKVLEDNFDRIETDIDENKFYHKGDYLHRTDGPAIEWKDGDKEWYINDKLHRLDGPAIERADGSAAWFQNGKRHRLDGPAIDLVDGTKFWYQNGERHRTDGPAIERDDGSAAWFQNDKRHRLDGPAIERADGSKEWYIGGVEYSEEKFNEKVKELNKLSWKVLEDNFDRIETDAYGAKRYYKEDKLHRLDGPAIESDSGYKAWFVNGLHHREDGPAIEQPTGNRFWFHNNLLHREDGPAIEYADGSKHWHQNDKLHRLDGPAREWSDGSKSWYIDGDKYTEEEFNEKVKELNKLSWQVQEDNFDRVSTKDNGDKLYFKGNNLHRLDGPAVERVDGGWSWYQNGLRHREDGPSIELADGSTYWFQNDKVHRLDGPAVALADGTKFWYQNGKLHRLDGPAIMNYRGREAWFIDGRGYTEEEFNEKVKELNKLSWQQVEDFTGWLVRVSYNRIHQLDERYAVIKKIEFIDDVPPRYWGIWRESEQEAFDDYISFKKFRRMSDGGLDTFISAVDVSIIPIKKIEDNNKLSWKELENPEDWVGWVVKIDEPENDVLYKAVVAVEKYTLKYFLPNVDDVYTFIGSVSADTPEKAVAWMKQLPQSRLGRTVHKDYVTPLFQFTSEKLSWQVQEDNFDRVETDAYGIKRYFKGDKYHRLDGPAVEYSNGDKVWFQNGLLHRTDGPAIQLKNGGNEWYQNGERHRLDGPAIESRDGDKVWYQNDKLHRLNGPAIERADGYKSWWVNDKIHRLDGPAIERANGDKEWFIDDKRYTEEEFNEKVKELNKTAWQQPVENIHDLVGWLVKDTGDNSYGVILSVVDTLRENLYGINAHWRDTEFRALEAMRTKGKGKWLSAIVSPDDFNTRFILIKQVFNPDSNDMNKLSWKTVELTNPEDLIGWIIKINNKEFFDKPLFKYVSSVHDSSDNTIALVGPTVEHSVEQCEAHIRRAVDSNNKIIDDEYIMYWYLPKNTFHEKVIPLYKPDLSKLSSKEITAIEHLSSIMTTAHEEEVHRKRAKFTDFRCYSEDHAIVSKTSIGYLETIIDPATEKIKNRWMDY